MAWYLFKQLDNFTFAFNEVKVSRLVYCPVTYVVNIGPFVRKLKEGTRSVVMS